MPVDGEEVKELPLETETTVETVVLLSHKKPDGHINVKVAFGDVYQRQVIFHVKSLSIAHLPSHFYKNP